MIRRRRTILLPVAVALLAATGCSHLREQTALLYRARSQYYDLTIAGIKEYDCYVQPDWDAFFTNNNNGKPPDDSPWHQYLRQAHLVFVAPLNGTATIKWVDPVPPPHGKEQFARDVQDGFHDVLDGFLAAWKPSLNGTLLPNVPVSNITPRGDGYTMTEHDEEGRTTDITMDKSLHVTHLSTRSPKLTAEIDTKYEPSPKGLLLMELDSLTHSPPTAPEKHSIMRTTYADVDGALVPATLTIITGSGTQILMKFPHCSVQK
jgi:hypothetical protein